ncbi:MAG: lysophospholipid acyltransferase family protein [Kofleriaceae bacterium]
MVDVEALTPARAAAPRADGDWDEEPADLDAGVSPSWDRGPADDDDELAAGDGGAVADDDVYLGEEAFVPPGEYGSVRSSWSSPGPSELRELERRLGAHRTPVFPIDLRPHLPMAALWRRWRRLAMWGRSEVVDDFGRDPIATARWEPVLEALYHRWFRVEASGVDHVPSTGRALLVANHGGTLPFDSAMVMHAIRRDHPARRDVRPLIEDAVFHLPYLGPLMTRLGGVRACPENAERLLARGELVAVFPEGVKGMSKLWRERHRLQRFGRGGFVKLALRTGTPIIPVAVIGAEETAPMLGRITWFAKSVGVPWVPVTPTFPWLGPLGLLPLPAKWMIEFGEPIDLAAEYGPERADDRLLVTRLADQIRAQLQGMTDALRARRGGAFG